MRGMLTSIVIIEPYTSSEKKSISDILYSSSVMPEFSTMLASTERV